MNNATMVALDTLDLGPLDPAAEIDALRGDIQARGLRRPVTVVRVHSTLLLVDGRRRVQAFKELGLAEIPARIVDAAGDGPAIRRSIRLVHGGTLTGLDEIRAVANLVPEFGGNQTQTALALGKNRTYVNQCCRATIVADSLGSSLANTQLSRSVLFLLATTANPQALLAEILAQPTSTVKAARAVQSVAAPRRKGRARTELELTQNNETGAFFLRVLFDPTTASRDECEAIAEALDRLRQQVRHFT